MEEEQENFYAPMISQEDHMEEEEELSPDARNVYSNNYSLHGSRGFGSHRAAEQPEATLKK